jgi:uncharacterized protein (TIGR00251 family)
MAQAAVTTKLNVRVLPRAKHNAVQRAAGGTWKVRLVAPPVDGKANAALVAYLASCLDLPRRAVRVVSGDKSREKLVAVDGLSAQEIDARLRRA